MKKLTTLFLRNVDLQLKNDFRSICVKQGKTMKGEIEKFMKRVVEKEEKKNV